jgi:dTDP-4-dehydrorhamnose 3,5-epimerase
MNVIISGQPIEGIKIMPLKQIVDERGMVMHMLCAPSFDFSKLGEVYFSVVNPGFVKGWKKHKLMHQNYAVCSGEIKLVIYDDRDHSPTKGNIQEIVTGRDRFALIHLPPLVWYSHIGLSSEAAVITNCTTMPNTAGEVLRLPPDTPLIPYSWMEQRKSVRAL